MAIDHRATSEFWEEYSALPDAVRTLADKQFALLKSDPQHPSLQFKKIGERHGTEIWSARVSLNYRALAIKLSGDYLWFWIGDHKRYDLLISQ
jgi:hypothetical protein